MPSSSLTEAASFSKGPARRWRLAGQRWVSPIALLLLWEGGSRAGLIPAHVLAAPSSILQSLWALTVSGELASNLAVSLMRVLAGLLIGVSIGAVLALSAGLSRLGEGLVDPPLQMLRTLPALALTPLFIVWFGIGETPKIALIALGVTFPIYLNLFNGIRGVDVRLVEAGRTLGLSGLELIREVVLPGALPSFLVGFRYALSVSILVLVVAESVNASAGLGYLINDARDYLRTDIIVVCLILYALLGLTADNLVRVLERRALAWRPAFLKP
jgi:sulfonate transport system permease protein